MFQCSRIFYWITSKSKISVGDHYCTQNKCERSNLAELSYPIPPNNVYIYEDPFKINLNLVSFLHDKSTAWHPLFISRKHYPRKANLLYWHEHYAPITEISRLFYDYSKHEKRKNIFIRWLRRYYTEESFATHQRFCNYEDFMSVVHVYFAAKIYWVSKLTSN